MKRTQNGGNRIRIILLILIISMSLSACNVENDNENIVTISEITDKHFESDSADTQPVTDLTIKNVPNLSMDVLNLRAKKYDDIPFWGTQAQLTEYVLRNLLYGRTEFEYRRLEICQTV